jgi:hypothetical protein
LDDPPRPYAGQRIARVSTAGGEIPVVGAMSEGEEARQIAAHGGPTIVSYGPFDPRREPVVLVHGMGGSGAELTKMADALRAAGKQVLVFFYDDRGVSAAVSGASFAHALIGLRARCPQQERLDIVAHSFGGIVTRAALSSLENPRWLDPNAECAAVPRAGFSAIRVRTLDTPWQGYGWHFPDIPIFTPLCMAILHFVLWLVGYNSAFWMRKDSVILQHLHDTQLHGVDFQNHAARQARGHLDDVKSIDDFGADDRLAIVRFLRGGPEPSGWEARNWCRMLQEDSRIGALRAAVGARSETAAADALASICDGVMRPIDGSHMDLAQGDPVVARVVGELRAR